MILAPSRHIAPDSEEIKNIKIIEGKTLQLQNGINVHYINAGTADVIRLDLTCDGGIRRQNQNAIASAVSSMLKEGTATKTAEQIADELDFYGAYLQTHCTPDDSVISLYCLKKYYSACVPYVIDILNESVFPEIELEIYTRNTIQRLLVNKQRNSFLVRRLFQSSVFGDHNPYGTFSEPGDYENISRETLLSFFNAHYKNKVQYILLSGSIDDSILTLSENLFSGLQPASSIKERVLSSGQNNANIFCDKPDSFQSAIRIGRKLFNRTHPDYRKLQILNLVLGGYFGSRLMKNIREEKGLTYGIHSALESYLGDGAFYIETEINNELREEGLREIYKEIALLRDVLIDDTELSGAKNYLLGSFLRSIDGPFSLADRHKILVDYGLNYDYYYEFIDLINQISAQELRELANQYLQEKDLSEIIVGKK